MFPEELVGKNIPVEILRGTFDLLKKDGWIQNHTSSDKGHCLLGAMNKVTTDIFYNHSMLWGLSYFRAAQVAIEKVTGIHDKEMPSLPVWNDKWYRTKWHVLWVLYRARRLLERHGTDPRTLDHCSI